MKKIITFIVILATLLSLTSCGNKFSAEKQAIIGTKWFSEAETSNSIVVWEFFEDTVSQSQYFIDGNGQHDSEKNTGSYKIKSDIIEVKFDDTDYVIPYKFENETFALDGGKYLSVNDVYNQIQGHWNSREVSYNQITGFGEAEHHIEFTENKFKIENASDAYRGAPGEYYYYGPYEGTFEIADGYFESSESKIKNQYFFLIEDGKVVIYRYTYKCSQGGEFPGQNGYKFN